MTIQNMAEILSGGNLEAEIAELTRQIEEKKRVLEGQSGIEREDKELVAETVAEHFYPTPANLTAPATDDGAPAAAPIVVVPQKLSDDYLNNLPAEQVEMLNAYIVMIPKDGIKSTVNKVVAENPFILDAFHDVLVTRLYDELKTRGIVR